MRRLQRTLRTRLIHMPAYGLAFLLNDKRPPTGRLFASLGNQSPWRHENAVSGRQWLKFSFKKDLSELAFSPPVRKL